MESLETLLAQIASALQPVNGIEAVVLGGSRARGVHRPDSDVDIGIYYDAIRLDLTALEAAAAHLNDDDRPNLIAAPGEWGPWVNGGAWLVVQGQRVDFVLRDLVRVREVMRETQAGIVSVNYQTGHPHAYLSATYMGELAICRIVWDRTGEVTRLHTEARVYPPALGQALIARFLFEAGFSCALAETYINKDEHYYVVAHLVRAVSALNQVLFACNQIYCLNEKGAVKIIEGFAHKPAQYKPRVDALFALAGSDLAGACKILRALVSETEALLAQL